MAGLDAPELPRAPAAERNIAPLTQAIEARLPKAGSALEIASGTGQHAAHWATSFPAIDWQPSDGDPAALAGIAAWRLAAAAPNLRAPLRLDVRDDDWWSAAPGPWSVLIAVNLLHIAPWRVTVGLLTGAANLLTPDGKLLLYGPFAEGGVLAPESNVEFDRWLRAKDPAFGVRDVDDVVRAAGVAGLALSEQLHLPANNRFLVFVPSGARVA